MPMYWRDKVSDWQPIYVDDERPERGRPTLLEDSPKAKRRTADHWRGVQRGWADDAMHHRDALAGLNRRHQEFWRRKS
jgi:hypothetical protein